MNPRVKPASSSVLPSAGQTGDRPRNPNGLLDNQLSVDAVQPVPIPSDKSSAKPRVGRTQLAGGLASKGGYVSERYSGALNQEPVPHYIYFIDRYADVQNLSCTGQ